MKETRRTIAHWSLFLFVVIIISSPFVFLLQWISNMFTGKGNPLHPLVVVGVVLVLASAVLILVLIYKSGQNSTAPVSTPASTTPPITTSPPPASAKGSGINWGWVIIGTIVVILVSLWLFRSHSGESLVCNKTVCTPATPTNKVEVTVKETVKTAPKPKLPLNEQEWRMRSVRGDGSCARSFPIKFVKKDARTMKFVVLDNKNPRVVIAEIVLTKPGKFGWEWFGRWDYWVEGDRGYIRLKEIPGSNGTKYEGDQTEGKVSDRWIAKTIVEMIN